MNKEKFNARGVVFPVFLIIAILYAVLSLILTADRNAVFWVGFCIFILADILCACIISFSNGSLPVKSAKLISSLIYLLSAFAVNILFGHLFKCRLSIFIAVHALCLSVYAITLLLITAASSKISAVSRHDYDTIKRKQDLEYIFKKILLSVADLPQSARKGASNALDSILEEIRFTDFSQISEDSEQYQKILRYAQKLNFTVENLIEIQSDDISAVLDITDRIIHVFREAK